MARTRKARTPTPDQLTLDDWAEILKVSSAAPEAPGRAATTVDAAPSAGAPENGAQQQGACAQTDGGFVRHHPVAKELLETPGALLTEHCSQSPPRRGTRTGVFTALNYHIAHLMGREPLLGPALVSRSAQRVVE